MAEAGAIVGITDPQRKGRPVDRDHRARLRRYEREIRDWHRLADGSIDIPEGEIKRQARERLEKFLAPPAESDPDPLVPYAMGDDRQYVGRWGEERLARLRDAWDRACAAVEDPAKQWIRDALELLQGHPEAKAAIADLERLLGCQGVATIERRIDAFKSHQRVVRRRLERAREQAERTRRNHTVLGVYDPDGASGGLEAYAPTRSERADGAPRSQG